MDKHYERWYNQARCDHCGHLGIGKEYGIMFNCDTDYADSISEIYCIKCIVILHLDYFWYKVINLVEFIKFYLEAFKDTKLTKWKSPMWAYRLYRLYKGGR